jgi:PAS domain S-box-containing protein
MLAAMATSAWLLRWPVGAIASHLLALLSGGAIVAGVRHLRERAERGPATPNGDAAPESIGKLEPQTPGVDATQLVQANAVLERAIEQERALVDRWNLAAQVGGLSVWDWNITSDSVLLDPMLARASGNEQPHVQSGARALFAAFAHPDDLAYFHSTLDAALAQGDLLEQRYRVRYGGHLLHVQVKGRIFRDAQGHAVRLLGVSRNITDQVRASEQLEQQAVAESTVRARLDLAKQTAGLSIFDMDASQEHVDPGRWEFAADPTFYQLFECASGAAAGELMAKVFPEDMPAVIGPIVKAMREGSENETTPMRYRVRLSQGVRHIQTNVRTYRHSSDGPRRLLGVTRDVTEEVEHANQLQALLDRFSVVMQAVKISPWEIDPAGKFLWVENRLQYEGLHQVSIAEYGDKFQELIPAEDREQNILAVRKALASGADTFENHFRVVLAGGVVRHMRSYAHIVRGPDGQPLRYVGATTDVTNDVQTTELLQRQAAQERVLLDRLNIATQSAGICSWDLDLINRQFLWVENPIEELSGLSGDGKSMSAFGTHLHPHDQGKFAAAARVALAEGRNQISYRYRAFSNQGRMLHLQVHARLMPDASGRITRALGVTWEVTREVETAEQLEQQAQRLHAAELRLERASLSSSEGHWEADLRGGRMWFSSSFHALLGYDNDALSTEGDALEQLVHPDDSATIRDALAAHLSAGTPYLADARLRMRSGEYRWFRQRGAAERDAGELTTIAGSLHDIHQQKLAEDALNLAQRRFERAINGTQDGLWELEADGTAWCSPRVAELLGHAPDTFPSDTHFLRMFLHPEDTQAVAAATQAHFQHEQPYDVEIRLHTAGGGYRWYRARASAERDAQGRPLRLSGSLQDVTEARAAREALLRATQAAEAASQAKSDFLANVSHEIRTPMNGIIGMTGLLLDTELDGIQRDYAETIRGSADSLLIVINDLLDFSKIEAGKLHIEALEMDLNETLEEVGSLLALQAAARNLEFIVHLHADVPGRVIGDPQRIRQCLINLIANAIKFTRAGEVVLEISNAGQREGQLLARFEVRDTGIGIAPDTLKNLFQPFVQADSSTTRHFGGTGLGLSIVRRLAEMMGGSVGVDSVLGEGSRFWFTLPLAPVALAQPQVDLTRLGKRVLVVDDNATVRRVFTSQLRHAGYETRAAGTGAEALACLQQGVGEAHPFDAVLANHQLPDMDAAALGQQITGSALFSETRVVVLTSLNRHGDSARFAKLGFAAYLHKPVRTRELLTCLDRVLARQAREWHLQSQPIVTRNSLGTTAARRCQGHVLLVEDNAVNQKVAVRFLERMGCTVRVADNGAEGVKAYREGRFDIVLMDLQMPVMDGLTATREIRALEDHEQRTPIVALTANAMTGQVDRCLQAGMNGFLSKPLEISRLQEVLERHGLSAALDGLATAHSAIPGPVDTARWQELTAGDREFAAELAGAFVTSGRQILEEIGAALGSFDRSALARAAHKLKGASANIHAQPLQGLAQELEAQSASYDQGRLKELVYKLRSEFDRTVEFMEQQSLQSLQQAASG